MTHEPFFPITASAVWVFGIFFFLLVIFHLTFLRFWKLSEKGWKYVDYIWISFAVLGLFAGTIEVRRFVAENQVSMQKAYMISEYSDLIREIGFLQGAAVCRKFNRTEWSPQNFDEIQNEFDKICSFARDLNKRMPNDPPEDIRELNILSYPAVKDVVLQDMLKRLPYCVKKYEDARKVYKETESAIHRSEIEIVFFILGPFFLAIALALRITKVTGELMLKKNA